MKKECKRCESSPLYLFLTDFTMDYSSHFPANSFALFISHFSFCFIGRSMLFESVSFLRDFLQYHLSLLGASQAPLLRLVQNVLLAH